MSFHPGDRIWVGSLIIDERFSATVLRSRNYGLMILARFDDDKDIPSQECWIATTFCEHISAVEQLAELVNG